MFFPTARTFFCWNWRGILVECYFRKHAKLDRIKNIGLHNTASIHVFISGKATTSIYMVCAKKNWQIMSLLRVFDISLIFATQRAGTWVDLNLSLLSRSVKCFYVFYVLYLNVRFQRKPLLCNLLNYVLTNHSSVLWFT